MMNTIMIIGAGQLGSRHLQALALYENPCKLLVVDPSRSNLEISKTRYEEIVGFDRHELKYYSSIIQVKEKEIDLAVIATNSNVRSLVIKELYKNRKVKYLILEKVLFQSIDEYDQISKLFHTNPTKVYVNHSRRMFQFYQKLKNIFLSQSNIQMEIVGNDWGLGCNGVHFIDLFSFLTGEFIESWENNLFPSLTRSKREGYYEFHGNISGKTLKGNSLSLTSFKGSNPNASVRISTERFRYTIEEWDGIARFIDTSSNIPHSEILLNIIPQSKLTNIVAEQLSKNDNCTLTKYEDACRVHVPFVKTILAHYNSISNGNTKTCPIT